VETLVYKAWKLIEIKKLVLVESKRACINRIGRQIETEKAFTFAMKEKRSPQKEKK
jgi:hypothetical protein